MGKIHSHEVLARAYRSRLTTTMRGALVHAHVDTLPHIDAARNYLLAARCAICDVEVEDGEWVLRYDYKQHAGKARRIDMHISCVREWSGLDCLCNAPGRKKAPSRNLQWRCIHCGKYGGNVLTIYARPWLVEMDNIDRSRLKSAIHDHCLTDAFLAMGQETIDKDDLFKVLAMERALA